MDAVPSIIGAVTTTIFHPLGYARVLIQIGHEPLDPYMSTTFFGKKQYYYPSVFKYIKYIKQRDGFSGLFRGLTPRLVGGVVGRIVETSTKQFLDEKFPEEKGDQNKQREAEVQVKDDMLKFLRDASKEMTVQGLALILSQPFQVIAIRSMAQFVGGETVYNSIFSGISEIYANEGFAGFFAGIIPKLIGESIRIFVLHLITELINKYLIKDKGMEAYTLPLCSLVVSTFTYPFLLVSTVMTVNGSKLAAANSPHMLYYPHWTDCWTHLSKLGQLKRGSSVIWRRVPDSYIMRRSAPQFVPMYQ